MEEKLAGRGADALDGYAGGGISGSHRGARDSGAGSVGDAAVDATAKGLSLGTVGDAEKDTGGEGWKK